MPEYEELKNIFKIEQILRKQFNFQISITLNHKAVGICLPEEVSNENVNKIIEEASTLIKNILQLNIDTSNKPECLISTNNEKQTIYVLIINR